jgi:CRP/FNR family cyclic AMP-dependent transcriptional regulator
MGHASYCDSNHGVAWMIHDGPADDIATRIVTGLPQALFDGLMASARRMTLAQDDVLFQAGAPGDGCYLVLDGALKATVNTPDGHERMLAVFGKGMMVGEMALVDHEERSATVTALRPSTLAYVSRDNFFRYADRDTSVYRHALRILAQRLRGTNEDTLAQGNATVAGRVARALLLLADNLGAPEKGGGRVIAQQVSQADIAAMAGAARENVSRVIAQWMRTGIMKRSNGRYVILRRDALKNAWDG